MPMVVLRDALVREELSGITGELGGNSSGFSKGCPSGLHVQKKRTGNGQARGSPASRSSKKRYRHQG